MAEYHVSAGMFGIYAGTLMPKKDGEPQMWRNKSDVTDEAICAVRDYMLSECLNEKNGKVRGGYICPKCVDKIKEVCKGEKDNEDT